MDTARLIEILRAEGITQTQAADRLGVSKQLVTHWVQGRREPSERQLQALAELVGVDIRVLNGGMEVMSAQQQSGLDSLSSADWRFRPAPQDGGRDYGNANVLAFSPSIATMVRELGQNALDQMLAPDGMVHVRFTLIELSEGGTARSRFLEALAWDRLQLHIKAAADVPNAKLSSKLREGLRRTDRLFILLVEDFGTTGAYGDERTPSDPSEKSPFAALIRDNLNSSKQTSNAGGTHGVGKGTAWQASHLSTVLLSSSIDPRKLRDGQPTGSLRFIAKSELTWHLDPDGHPMAGPGWLAGPPQDFNSLWVAPHELKDLFLDRLKLPEGVDEQSRSGTSLAIVGFRDPQEDDTADPVKILDRIKQAVSENFFPAILEGRLSCSVEYRLDGELESASHVKPEEYVPEMVEAYKAHRDGEIVNAESAGPGDTIREEVVHGVPRTRVDAVPSVQRFDEDLDAKSYLLVRYAKNDELGNLGSARRQLANHVALVRGRLMVVQYSRQSHLVVGGRQFHGILLAGEAVDQKPAQRAAEQFLRLSEPAAHDEWTWRDDVRDNYRSGAKRQLESFREEWRGALRRLVEPEQSDEDEGPDELRKLFALPGQPRPSPGTVVRLQEQQLRGGQWHIAAELVINNRSCDRILVPALSVQPESGNGISLDWDSLSIVRCTRGRASVTEKKAIEVTSGTSRVVFKAVSKSAPDHLNLAKCRVTLRVGSQEREALGASAPSREGRHA